VTSGIGRGALCLQGGAELGDDCREMDTAVLAVAPDGPVVVVPLAPAPGFERRTTGEHATRYYSSLTGREVVVTEDADDVRSAAVVVLPGGSPARLLGALRDNGIDAVLGDVLGRGGVVSGASAGAMVLGPVTVLPERGRPQVVAGLGLSPYAVVPHYRGRSGWTGLLRAADAGVLVLGIPEQSGLLVTADAERELGVGAVARL
jgi:cyanophycinase-like exopeptidase